MDLRHLKVGYLPVDSGSRVTGCIWSRLAAKPNLKMRVAVADLLLVISVGVALVSHYMLPQWVFLLGIQFPFALGAFWLYLSRLKCPHCGRRLSQDFPLGALLALPCAKQPCRQCGKVI